MLEEGIEEEIIYLQLEPLIYPIKFVSPVFVSAQVPRAGVAFEFFSSRGPATEAAQSRTGLFRFYLLVRHRLKVFADPETASVSCRLASGQNMVGADDLNNAT
jgi:hypothetical protein